MANEFGDIFDGAWHPEDGDSHSEEQVPGEIEFEGAGDMLPDKGAEVVDLETWLYEEPPAPFGLDRFEAGEPHFEGKLPDEFLAQTVTPACEVLHGPESYWQKYDGLFVDRDVIKYPGGPAGSDVTKALDSLKLEYHAPEGIVLITSDNSQAEMWFHNNDDQLVSHSRYYLGVDSAGEDMWARPDDENEFDEFIARTVLYKGNIDVTAASSGWWDRSALVSPEEVAYAFGEVMARARPASKSYHDVQKAVLANEPIDDPHIRRVTRGLFNTLLYQYRLRYSEGDVAAPISGDLTTEIHHMTGDDGVETTNVTGMLSAEGTLVSRPYVMIVREEPLDTTATHALLEKTGRPPASLDSRHDSGSSIVQTIFSQNNKRVFCHQYTAVRLPGLGVHTLPPAPGFPADLELIRTLRNYLWGDVSEFTL